VAGEPNRGIAQFLIGFSLDPAHRHGVAIHPRRENDSDGVNIRDYWINNEQRFTATGAFETLVRHNCLTAQTDG
jgi:hypothetical protein